MKRRSWRPSPSVAIACLALFVALGGTGYAVTKIHGSNLVNRSVSGVKLKRDTVTKTEVNEAGIAAAGTIMNGRPGPLNDAFQASFKTSGGPILIIASGSGYRAAAGEIGMNVLVDGLVRGEARVFTNEASSHKAFVTSGIPVTGLARGTHTLRLAPLSSTQTDANDLFTVTVLELSLAGGIGADRWEEDDAVGQRHGGACQPLPDVRTNGAATIWPAGDDDWWDSNWSWTSQPGEIELRVVGGPRMDVYLQNTTTRLARNVRTFRKVSILEWYDIRVHNPKGVSYALTCRLVPPSPGVADASGEAPRLVQSRP